MIWHKFSPSEDCPVVESIQADVDGSIPAEDKEPDVEKAGDSELVEVVKTSGIVEDSELAEAVQWTVEDTEHLEA